jgi:hypothetical protein
MILVQVMETDRDHKGPCDWKIEDRRPSGPFVLVSGQSKTYREARGLLTRIVSGLKRAFLVGKAEGAALTAKLLDDLEEREAIRIAAVEFVNRRADRIRIKAERAKASQACKDPGIETGKPPCWLRRHKDDGTFWDDCCPSCEQAREKHKEYLEASKRAGIAIRELVRIVRKTEGGPK